MSEDSLFFKCYVIRYVKTYKKTCLEIYLQLNMKEDFFCTLNIQIHNKSILRYITGQKFEKFN